ncbi:hypothetical protein ACFL23_00440 [Patescibacteria group bacterium]
MKFIFGVKKLEIIKTAEFAVKIYENLPCNRSNENPKKGGILSIRDEINFPSFIEKIGTFAKYNYNKFFSLSLEQSCRLGLNENHISSFQSVDKLQKNMPGAVRFDHKILSLAGFAPSVNESIVLVIALLLRWGDLEQAITIAKLSNNNYFNKHYDNAYDAIHTNN